MKINARINNRFLSDKTKAILTIIPSVIFVGIFIYGFIVWNLYTSFSDWDQILPSYKFVGFKNYIDLFQTERFLIDIRNTISFTAFFIALCVVIGLVLALILDSGIDGAGIFQTIFIFPMAISFIVSGVVWRWLLNPSHGINLLMQNIGFESFEPKWYTNPEIIHFKADNGLGMLFDKLGLTFLTSDLLGVSIAIFSIIIAATWQFSGYTMAVYLGALKAIPEEIREASLVDGASAFQHIFHIVLPILKPITLGILIILGHISLKIFDLVSAMTGPGPGFATDVPAYFMFDTTFRGNHFAQGATISTIILISVLVLIIPYIRNKNEMR
jgi:glucose/mannose transport system permease protein